jgi:hypothetical protein
MIKINKALTIYDSITVASGAVIDANTTFDTFMDGGEAKLKVVWSLQLWKDQDSLEASNAPIITNVKELPYMMLSKVLTTLEKTSLESQSGVMSLVEGWLKQEIAASSSDLQESDMQVILL